MTGMVMSMRTTLGFQSWNALTASAPFSASRVVNPTAFQQPGEELAVRITIVGDEDAHLPWPGCRRDTRLLASTVSASSSRPIPTRSRTLKMLPFPGVLARVISPPRRSLRNPWLRASPRPVPPLLMPDLVCSKALKSLWFRPRPCPIRNLPTHRWSAQ